MCGSPVLGTFYGSLLSFFMMLCAVISPSCTSQSHSFELSSYLDAYVILSFRADICSASSTSPPCELFNKRKCSAGHRHRQFRVSNIIFYFIFSFHKHIHCHVVLCSYTPLVASHLPIIHFEAHYAKSCVCEFVSCVFWLHYCRP